MQTIGMGSWKLSTWKASTKREIADKSSCEAYITGESSYMSRYRTGVHSSDK
jgi:hypothetical protein